MESLASDDIDYLAPLDTSAPLASGLVAWWKALPGRIGGTRWVDLVQGRVGTLTGMAAPGTAASGWGLGERGAELHFDGTDDYVTCGSAAALMPAQFTIAHGLRPATLTPAAFDSFYAATQSTSWTQGYGAFHTTAAPPLSTIAGQSYQAWVEGFNVNFVRIPILLSTWQHCIVTWDGATIRGYWNGRLADSVAYAGSMTTGHTLELGRGFSDSFNYDGALDEWMLYRRALSPREATALYGSWTLRHPTLLRHLSLPVVGMLAGMHPVGRLTRLEALALYTRLAGDFSGKEDGTVGPHPVGRLTRLDLLALYTRLAGSFAGKASAEEEAGTVRYIPLWKPRRGR